MHDEEELGSKKFFILDEVCIFELASAIHVMEEPVSNIRRNGWNLEPIFIFAKNK